MESKMWRFPIHPAYFAQFVSFNSASTGIKEGGPTPRSAANLMSVSKIQPDGLRSIGEA